LNHGLFELISQQLHGYQFVFEEEFYGGVEHWVAVVQGSKVAVRLKALIKSHDIKF
jgi:hypothetical protein